MAYKKCLIATTKNLFDIPLTQGYPSNTAYNADTKRTFTVGTYVTGLASNNYYNPKNITNVNVSKDIISFKVLSASGYGIGIPLLLTAGKTYTASSVVDNNFYPGIGISYYKEDGTQISYTQADIVTNSPTVSFTIPENTYFTVILFYGRSNNSYVFSSIQIESGSTATSYVPYGYLPSYKKIIKVNNNPVQLLDKSVFITSDTKVGLTFTCDRTTGAVTVNGTATSGDYWNPSTDRVRLINGHKYLTCGNYVGSRLAVGLLNQDSGGLDYGVGGIVTAVSSAGALKNAWGIVWNSGITFNNVTIKPQVFDLTAMFGKGNEPTTLQEFRAKYPNSYYYYNPSQYLVSYRKNLVTDGSTKNLFNVNNLNVYTPDTLPRETVGVYNGNIIARSGPSNSTSRTNKTLQELCPNLEVGKTYILNFETTGTNTRKDQIYLNISVDYWTKGTSRTITANDLNSFVYFYANYPDLTVATISHFQIEEGTVATSYVPYQYL